MAKLDETLLMSLPPFSRLDRPQIRAILDQATPRRYEEGVAVFGEGLPAERFYLLLDGHIRLVRTTRDGEQVIGLHIPPGQLFGIAPAIGRDTYPATAVCASEVLALSWPVRLWSEFIAKYDGFATETYRTLGARLGEIHNRVAELATNAVEQRVAAVLLRLVNQSGRKAPEGQKGMFMGGNVPLGYVVKDRKLVVSEPEAAIVRSMFERFVRIGSATVLARELRAEGVCTKRGKLVDKGYLYKLLNNQTYLGLAVHKGTEYPGEHAAIIDQDLWDKVHAILAENAHTRSANTPSADAGALEGAAVRA